jgi:hypothetical protein
VVGESHVIAHMGGIRQLQQRVALGSLPHWHMQSMKLSSPSRDDGGMVLWPNQLLRHERPGRFARTAGDMAGTQVA